MGSALGKSLANNLEFAYNFRPDDFYLLTITVKKWKSSFFCCHYDQSAQKNRMVTELLRNHFWADILKSGKSFQKILIIANKI